MIRGIKVKKTITIKLEAKIGVGDHTCHISLHEIQPEFKKITYVVLVS